MSNCIAQWPAPKHIRALTTSLSGGHSIAPYSSNNLALHVGDLESHVLANRHQLRESLALPAEPAWLNQTHSTRCITIEETTDRNADAAVTRVQTQPLVILTADCLPIVLCNTSGTEIAAIHAGWRGLLNGIIQSTLDAMHASPHTLLAWIGPAICQRCYQVGPEIKQQFTEKYPFTAIAFDGEHANLAHMAELILLHHGVLGVFQSNHCTFEQKNSCYSYRRSSQTGRMGTLIWFDHPKDN